MDINNPEFWSAEEIEMWNRLAPEYIHILNNGINGGVALLPRNVEFAVDWDLINTAALEQARTYRYTWIRKITETTRRFVQTAVANWIESGAELEALRMALEPELGIARAARIAVTEVTRVYAMGNKMAWGSTGYITNYLWNTAQDELVCPICGERAGKTFPLNEIESDMPAHVNCRCWATPVVNYDLFEQQIGAALNE